jgi:precorrin-6Y C5,15-methyltransferase (decarboxylating)
MPVTVVGTGLSPGDLPPAHRKAIEAADVLAGGRRLLEWFPDHPAERIEIGKDVESVVDRIRAVMETRRVVVLASGDPLFFGIGATLVHRLGAENVRIIPNISALTAALAALNMPWAGTGFISLHGRRRESALLEALEVHERLAVLTDTVHTPAWIARKLLPVTGDDITLFVLEQLGGPGETVSRLTPSQTIHKSFRAPNIVILERKRPAPVRPLFGLPDDAITHKRGMITKAEVRAVTLSRLRLTPSSNLWDLGAGSGAVAVEAAAFIRTGRIVAVEKRADRAADIRKNRDRHRAWNLHVYEGHLPDAIDEALAAEPDPDRIFVGGGGRRLPEILAKATAKLKPGGILGVNTVLLQNAGAAVDTLRRLGFRVDFVQVQISRSSPMPGGDRLEAQNPVTVITGCKNEE